MDIKEFLKNVTSSRVMVENRWLMWAFGKWTVFAPSKKQSATKADIIHSGDDLSKALDALASSETAESKDGQGRLL